MSIPALLTVVEACAVLQVSRATLYAHIRTGEIRSMKIGRVRRISQESLRAFISARTVDTAAERLDHTEAAHDAIALT